MPVFVQDRVRASWCSHCYLPTISCLAASWGRGLYSGGRGLRSRSGSGMTLSCSLLCSRQLSCWSAFLPLSIQTRGAGLWSSLESLKLPATRASPSLEIVGSAAKTANFWLDYRWWCRPLRMASLCFWAVSSFPCYPYWAWLEISSPSMFDLRWQEPCTSPLRHAHLLYGRLLWHTSWCQVTPSMKALLTSALYAKSYTRMAVDRRASR